MGRKLTMDYILDSNGLCFFCLNKLSPQFYPTQQQTEPEEKFESHAYLCTLQYLSRYLELDLTKFLTTTDSSPLLADLLLSGGGHKTAKLNVKLCQGCTAVNERFSKLYRLLEKMDLEVMSSLELILRKFVIGKGRDGRTNVDQFMELREVTMQKCSRKLRNLPPRVELPNLTKQQIRKHGNSSPNFTSSVELSEPFISPQNIKAEDNYFDDTDYEQGADYDCDAQSINYQYQSQEEEEEQDEEPEGTRPTETGNDTHIDISHILGTASASSPPTEMDPSHLLPPNLEKGGKKKTPKRSKKNKPKSKSVAVKIEMVRKTPGKKPSKPCPYIILRPDTLLPSPKSLPVIINPKTSQRKCPICRKEFKAKSFKSHYKHAHLQFRYKCLVCGREFPRGDICVRHHRSVHLPVFDSKYKCGPCGKVFQRKDHLTKHQGTLGHGLTQTFPARQQ